MCSGSVAVEQMLSLTENMPIDDLLKRYGGYGSDGHVPDLPTDTATAKKNLRSSSKHQGYIRCKFTFCLP